MAEGYHISCAAMSSEKDTLNTQAGVSSFRHPLDASDGVRAPRLLRLQIIGCCCDSRRSSEYSMSVVAITRGCPRYSASSREAAGSATLALKSLDRQQEVTPTFVVVDCSRKNTAPMTVAVI